MKEQGQIESSMPGQTTAGPPHIPEPEYLTVAARGKKVRKTTYLLVVLFGAGLLCVLFMIKKSTPQKAQAQTNQTVEAQIEAALSSLMGIKAEIFSRMDGIVKKFYEFSDVQQIKVNELVKNPFERDLFLGSLERVSTTDAEDAALMRQRQLSQQAKELRLVSIIRSTQGDCCMINDKILYQGDSIKDFKVAQISQDSVKLEWGQNQSEKVSIVLKLEE
jgi:hypothetical protein